MKRSKLMLGLVMLVMFAVTVYGQDEPDSKRSSPIAIAAIRYKDAYIKITYSQPQKNGRDIFGKLIPYGKVWRTGANEATEITVTKNITLQGFLLKAGTYSIFTIPEKEKWTIIINSELGLWGSYNYNSRLDVLRFSVIPQGSPVDVYEAFTIQLDQHNESANLMMMWDKVKVIVPVKFLN